MAWCKADGSPVATKPLTIQIDVPADPVATVGSINWSGVISAVLQLSVALATQNPAAIAAAVQALLAALMGN